MRAPPPPSTRTTRLLPSVRLPANWLDAWPRVPAMPVALAMAVGVLLGRSVLPVWPWAWLLVASVAVAAAIVGFAHAWRCTLALLLTIASCGAAVTQLVAFRYPANHITHYVGDDQRLCRLRLYLPNEPRLRGTTIFGERYPRQPSQSTLARVTHVLTTTGWRDASGDVLVQIHQPLDALHAGQTIEMTGFIERPGIAMNPGQFDWQRYYRAMGVLNSVTIQKRENIRILARDAPPAITQWREYVRRLFDSGFTKEQSLDHALMSALLLGDYDPELRDVKDDFRKTGTSHHLAISGMHVAVVGGLAFLLLRLVGFGPRACWIVAMTVVAFYGLAATPSPPVLRAVILFGAAGLAFCLRRFSGALQMLAISVVVLLSFHPLDLFNAGFQLSFGTVLGLILLSEPMAKKWARDEAELQILLPEEIERLPTGRKLKRWADRATLRLLAAGVVAWLVSMPLIAAQFQQLNPWQVATSVALGPLVTMSLLAGVLKVIGTAVVPPAAPWLAALSAMFSRWMRELVAWMATWPYGDVPLAAPPAWLVAICWIALALAVVRWRMATARLAAGALLVLTFGYMLVGPYWFGPPSALRSGQTRITLMAVGAGQCALVETNGRVAMLDCGSTSLADLTANVVAPLLRDRSVNHVDQMMISHANTDHYSHVAEVAGSYSAHEVMTADGFEADARATDAGQRLLTALRAEDLPPRVVHVGDHVPISSDVWIEVLGPPPGMTDDNDRSLVTRLHVGTRTILFTGDIQAGGMRALLANPEHIRSDVLIAPHHGSSEDITPSFVDAVGPQWILSSNDRTLSGKQQRFDAMMAGRRVLRTNEYGAITVVIDRDGTMTVDGFVKRP